MTLVQYYLSKLAEECLETGHRALKAQKFGLEEIQTGHTRTNADRIEDEFCDLLAVVHILKDRYGMFKTIEFTMDRLDIRLTRIDKYLKLSQDLGETECQP